jgi:choline dehydrogenase-like flavoprotein
MSRLPFSPDDPGQGVWDVVVVGTGMGGSTAGYALAQLGWRVLFLERGRFLFNGAERGDGHWRRISDDPAERLDRGVWPNPIKGKTTFGEIQFFAPLGCGSGGSTSIYAAQLERLLPADFKPRANYPEAPDSTLPDAWPISYEELVPYYRRAEMLFRVTGTPDPLNPDPEAVLRDPPPLSARDQDLFHSFQELGLHPYRAHAGFEYLPGCEECAAVLCPRGCKNDAGRICLMPALENHGARILADCEVLGFDGMASDVRKVRCRWNGRTLAISAKIIVLAAGAWMTPVLLLNSVSQEWPNGLANSSGHVGRNLMLHATDFIAVRPRRAGTAEGPKKALAVNDFYIWNGRKLGTFQSVGAEVDRGYVLDYLRSLIAKAPRWQRRLVRPVIGLVARIAAVYFRNAAVYATIVEDLPYFENRVVADPQAPNGMRFEYRYTQELSERSRMLQRNIYTRLKPHHRIIVLTGKNNINFGHVCGTCRFGIDPATSVLDRNNRAHDITNLYVLDASFFPSSSGTNPSLTIAANALRVSEVIDRQLRAL